MPIPKPNPKEPQQKYISRCHKFLHDENKTRKKKRSNEQISAICFGIWRRKDYSETEIDTIIEWHESKFAEAKKKKKTKKRRTKRKTFDPEKKPIKKIGYKYIDGKKYKVTEVGTMEQWEQKWGKSKAKTMIGTAISAKLVKNETKAIVDWYEAQTKRQFIDRCVTSGKTREQCIKLWGKKKKPPKKPPRKPPKRRKPPRKLIPPITPNKFTHIRGGSIGSTGSPLNETKSDNEEPSWVKMARRLLASKKGSPKLRDFWKKRLAKYEGKEK